jgi:UDP-N-acetylglucosamine acyltransferase
MKTTFVKTHPLAAVSHRACVADDVSIGPFCVIEDDVTIEEGCTLESSVVIKSGVTLGPNNRVFEGAILGGPPQHVHMPERPGRVVIGSGNVLREFVTVHRALEDDGLTIIGDNNLLMAGAHVAHDCRVGNNTILTNNVLLAGHVTVEDRAYLSGAAAVHQYCRIGTLAMVGGHARVNKDVPPFVTIDGGTTMAVGLNQIGLRRAGYSTQDIEQLKAAYRMIYRSNLTWNEILKGLLREFAEGPAAHFHQFLTGTTRGILPERRLPPGATLKLRREEHESQPELRVKAS